MHDAICFALSEIVLLSYICFISENKQALQNAKLELKKSKRKDYYKILGVHKTAREDEIKKAYKKRALMHHPGISISFHLIRISKLFFLMGLLFFFLTIFLC